MRDGTAGKNRWWPGLGGSNCTEWHVTTTAAGSPAHMDDQRAPKRITLADGTKAELLTAQLYEQFYVRTNDALIEIVTARQEDPATQLAIARSLRHVTP